MLTRDTTHKFARPLLALGALLLVFTGAAWAQDDPEPENGTDEPPPTDAAGGVIELESRVTGNKEQPQVFYVVPWQSPDSPRPDYDPLGSQLQDVFGHLEREELKRELDQRLPAQAGPGNNAAEAEQEQDGS